VEFAFQTDLRAGDVKSFDVGGWGRVQCGGREFAFIGREIYC